MAKKKPVNKKKTAGKPERKTSVKKAVKLTPAAKKTATKTAKSAKTVRPVKATKKIAVKALKAEKKPGKQPSRPAAKPAVKPARVTDRPSRPAARPVSKEKPAPSKAPAKGPAKSSTPAPAAPKSAPLKVAPGPVKNSDPAPKSKKAAPAPLPPPPSNLPKLPKGIVLKKQKGKLAPGEKRIVKTEVITHHVLDDLPLDELNKRQKPEPKGKFQLEYIIHTPITLLYDFLTTPNGLAEWFADGVDMKNDIYTFDWDGQKQNARIIGAKIDNYIRLRWLDKPEGSYFEFRLNQDELTNEVSLIVTDFGDGEDDIATSRRLWDSQIHRLVKALGTY